jgi:CubicO group peptidase (beta-lactamase class C family)
LDTLNLAVADRVLQAGADEGVYTHGVYRLAVRGETVAAQAFGAATPDTVFDLASLTKPLATATLLLQSVERAELHLRQTLEPLFGGEHGSLSHLATIDLRYLATHTSGLPPLPEWPEAVAGAGRIDLLRRALKTVRAHPPGGNYAYSDTGYILLAEILSQITATPLDTLFQTRIAEPAGLANLRFLPPPDVASRIAPTSTTAPPGVVHDPRARDLGGVAGHAGLFGTAGDVLQFLEIVRKGGGPLVSPASVAKMMQSQIETTLGGQSIGWFCHGNELLPSGDLFSDQSIGHSGFTGCMVLIDPAYDVSLVLLTNRVISGAQDASRYLTMRRCFTNAVAAVVSGDPTRR